MKEAKKGIEKASKSQINFAVPEHVKRAFKASAASEGMTIEQAGVIALEQFLAKRGSSFLNADPEGDSLLAA